MRIGIVLAAVPGYSETFFRSKITGLKEHGFEVLLFAQGPKGEFNLCPYIPGLKAEKSPKELFYVFSSLMQLLVSHPRKIIRFLKAERQSGRSWKAMSSNLVFSSHILLQQLDWLHFGFGTMAIGKESVAKAMGAKMAISLRGFDIAIYPLKHIRCYQLVWSCIDKLHVISDDLKALAIKEGLLQQTQVVKITPAIDVHQFHTTRDLNKPLSCPLNILTVARLHWKKGLEDTLIVMSKLKSKNIVFEYTIIGEGDEYERLIYAAHKLGLQEQVNFAGKKNPEAVKQAMETCDLYIQYSISEGFCNAVLEAQAMGCLCVVSDAEGLPENVIHGVTGWVVPKKSPELLEEQILHIAHSDTEILNRIRQSAIQHVQTNFGIENQIASFVKFYKN